MRKIAILGGGLAGLSAGFFAAKKDFNFRIYEANDEVGGNCRTLSFGEFKIDTGAHRFHDKDPEMTKEVMKLMGDKLTEVNVPSFIFHNGRLIHFPLTPVDVFKNLTYSVFFKAIWHFISGKFNYSSTGNFETLVYNKYGKTVADLFLTNYSKKLWGEECKNLSLDVAGSRLKNLNLNSVITEFLFRKNKSKHLEGAFFYPAEGFGEITKEMAGYCGIERIKTNNRITEIQTKGRRIEKIVINKNKAINTEIVINSLPISMVIRLLNPAPPKEILDVAQKLKFRHIKLVIVLLNKKSVNNAATMYFPDKKFVFTRCYEPRNRSATMSPEGKTSLVAEVPHSLNDNIAKLTDTELMDKVKEQLLATRLFFEEEIINVFVYSIPFAYPVLIKDYESEFRKLHFYLDRFENFYNTGRNGLFQYSWVHNMMRWGKEIVDSL